MLHNDAISATTISNIPKYLKKIYIYLKYMLIRFFNQMIAPVYFRRTLHYCNINHFVLISIT